jgi:hypothetical protein
LYCASFEPSKKASLPSHHLQKASSDKLESVAESLTSQYTNFPAQFQAYSDGGYQHLIARYEPVIIKYAKRNGTGVQTADDDCLDHGSSSL